MSTVPDTRGNAAVNLNRTIAGGFTPNLGNHSSMDNKIMTPMHSGRQALLSGCGSVDGGGSKQLTMLEQEMKALEKLKEKQKREVEQMIGYEL